MQNDGRVVNFTNITTKDFSHPWGGTPFFVKAGETMTFPYPLAVHLAKHLARRILLEGDTSATTYDPKNPDPAGGKGEPLWNEETEKQVMGKILGGVFQQEVAKPKSEIELLKEQIAQLNERVDAGIPVKEEAAKEESKEPETVANIYKDKSDVIAELTKRGIKFDARKSKSVLEKLLEPKEEVSEGV